MVFYRILLFLVFAIGAGALFVFGSMLMRGGATGSDMLTWLAIVAVIGLVIWGAMRLAARGRVLFASLLLALLAVPVIGYVVFIYFLIRALGGH